MQTVKNQIVDIAEAQLLASKICKKFKVGDVIFLKGELGTGKTTLSGFIINHLHILHNLPKPNTISSPTFPLLLTYDLNFCEIYHYDFYRIKNIKEIEELDFFENIENSITLIEWPELLIKLPFKINHYLINLELYSNNTRIININYFDYN